MAQINPTIQYLTDDVINLFAGENKLTTWRDTNGRIKEHMATISGGPLDSEIFGSCFKDKCNCGQVHGVSRNPCRNCKSVVLDENTAWTRFAKIELPVFYCNELRKNNFIQFMRNTFTIDVSKLSDETLNIVADGNPFFVWDYCQFEYDGEKNSIVALDVITDLTHCSFEGLLLIMIEHFPEHLDQFKSYINTNVLVTPIISRAPYYADDGTGLKLFNHEVTIAYICILHAILVEYPKAMEDYKTPQTKSLYLANLREFVCSCLSNISRLLAPSKENFAREMQSHRISNSGRCTIVPAPDLPVDEVYIPRHLMYECCEDEFIKFMMNELGISKEAARVKYRTQAMNQEVQDLFSKYIDTANGGNGKYVIINRNPTLYELGMMACRVRLTNDYTIGLPLLLCSPFGGDYDGDTFSFYSLPDILTDDIVSKMSPRNLIYYKKSQSHLYLPSHEIMGGLITGTRKMYQMDDNGNPVLMTFDSYDDAYQYKRKHRDFKWQSVFLLKDENGNTKETTLGRLKFSELFGVDMEEFLNDGKVNLTSKEIPLLYDKLIDDPERLEKIQAIQEFALTIATTSGATAPSLSDLHAHLDPSYINKIREIEKMEALSDREKDVKIRQIYEKYMDDIKNGEYDTGEVDKDGNPIMKKRLDEDLKLQISDSSRAKIDQLLNIVAEQLTVGPDHVAHVTSTTIINGMNPTDFTAHSIENRGTQDIKVSATPRSGYTTRQLVFLGKCFYYTDEPDPKNPGIFIPMRSAEGRTTVDGNVITKEEARKASKDDMVKVRSIVTSSFTKHELVSKDCISVINNWSNGDHVGVSLLSSLTEGLTQSGLSLKHGGRLFETDKLAALIAQEDCTLQITDLFVIAIGKSGKTYQYPKSPEFVVSYSPTGTYKKGEILGVVYRQFTPSYRLDCVIKLIGAASSSSRKKVINNKVLITECYAYSSGKIHYVTTGTEVTAVEIGGHKYQYSPMSCYFYPEGSEVKEGQRFCTGTLDVTAAIKAIHDRTKVFYLFKSQFDELIAGMAPELVEFVYSLIITERDGRIVQKTVQTSVLDAPGFLNKLAFREAKKTLKKIDYQGQEFIPDASADLLLANLLTMVNYM